MPDTVYSFETGVERQLKRDAVSSEFSPRSALVYHERSFVLLLWTVVEYDAALHVLEAYICQDLESQSAKYCPRVYTQ